MNCRHPSLVKDFIECCKRYDQWLYMAWWDLKSKYRRTTIGPFWLVIVTFISISCMSVLGSLLFKMPMQKIFPYIACGMVIWGMLTSLVMESCSLFINYSWMLSNLNLNPILLCMRLFMRNVIAFAHSMVILILVLLYYNTFSVWSFILSLGALLIYLGNAISLCITLGFLATRYRDLVQIVQAVMNILVFMTPVMWQKDMLGDKVILAEANPFTHFIDIIRMPLLSQPIPEFSLIYVAIFTLLNVYTACYLYRRFKHRLVFWL